MRASIWVGSALLCLTGCYSSTGSYARAPTASHATSEVRHRSAMASKRANPARQSTEDLEDLGGAVIPESSIYAIWWGQASRFTADTMSGMDTFLSGLDGSRYLGTADQYVGKQTRAKFVGHLMETSASPTHSPSTEEIVAKVCEVLDEAKQPKSATALYLVFTDGFPEQSNFCAWHDGGKCPDGTKIHVAYLPNLANAPQCDGGDLFHCNTLSEPTRALANVTAHEVIEMITDPDGDGWLDADGEEIADKCAWRFSSCVSLGSSRWQLQKEWSNADHACVQEKVSPAPRVASRSR